MSTFLVTAGIILLTLGAIAYLGERRAHDDRASQPSLQLLPGDIKYESPSGNFRFYFPITTSIVLSIVLTLIMRFLS
jgi:hypothetical protein